MSNEQVKELSQEDVEKVAEALGVLTRAGAITWEEVDAFDVRAQIHVQVNDGVSLSGYVEVNDTVTLVGKRTARKALGKTS